MCILFLFFNPEAGPDEWEVVLASNRDEFLYRPALPARWREEDILYGTDETRGKEGGTWLGLNKKSGKIAILLNILEPPEATSPSAKGRGTLVKDFLHGSLSAEAYAASLEASAGEYNGFQIILMEKLVKENSWDVRCFSNRSEPPSVEILEPGVYGFGNSTRDRPFFKVQDGLKHFQQALLRNQIVSSEATQTLEKDLVALLKNDRKFPGDPQILAQGKHIPQKYRDEKSSCFIDIKDMGYGTRTHTLLTLDGTGEAVFTEDTITEAEGPEDQKPVWEKQKFQFKM